MDYSVRFQKLFPDKTMKLLLVLGVIASVLVLQSSFSLPYGYVFSSSISNRDLLPEKSNLRAGGLSPKSDMVDSLPSLNSSILHDSFVVPEMVIKVEPSVVEEETDPDIVIEGKDLNSELVTEMDEDLDHDPEFDDRNPDNETSPSPSPSISLDENSRLQNSREQVSTSPNIKEPKEGSPVDQFRNQSALDDGQKEDKLVSADALPPVLPFNTTSMAGNQAPRPLTTMYSQGGPASPNNVAARNKSTANEKYNDRIPPSSVISISEMSSLLIKSRSTTLPMKPRWSSTRDKEILFARKQIENAPVVKSDSELHAPLFRNISMFKRSYELMERMLKVYVYKEGKRPIFHSPPLKGIYASEGWFMKQMEGNKKFVVRDPRKAHLFYLPFSTRALQYSLYVPNSHSHKNMIAYLKNYLDAIAAKYPFWNRTGGADHFLAACHDWAPQETRDYMSNCIRALCNSDVNVGFEIGKDASLPETYVRSARNPLRDIGGEPPSERKILAFFAGGMHGYLRPILLKHWEDKDPDMHIYGPMGRGKTNKMNYIRSMKSSKYCICARGYEVNSPRVVEAIFYECVPVIISDNFVPPFFEVLNWEAFAVFVPEKDIKDLKNILLSIPEEKYRTMQMKVKEVQKHFLWNNKPVKYDVFHMILHSIWYNRVFQLRV